MPTLEVADSPSMLSPRAMTVPGIRGAWVVAKVVYQREKEVAARLVEAGYDYFLPLLKKPAPGYLSRAYYVPLPDLRGFVFCASEGEIVPGYNVPTDLFYALEAMRPAVYDQVEVPAGAQRQLVRELNEIHAAVWRNPNWADWHKQNIEPTRKCRVKSGPFQGREARVDKVMKKGRVSLPITILGRTVDLDVPAQDLEL